MFAASPVAAQASVLGHSHRRQIQDTMITLTAGFVVLARWMPALRGAKIASWPPFAEKFIFACEAVFRLVHLAHFRGLDISDFPSSAKSEADDIIYAEPN